MRRVVARAHGVDVRALHHHDVLDHRVAVERAARVGMVLVPVHAAERHRAAVHREARRRGSRRGGSRSRARSSRRAERSVPRYRRGASALHGSTGTRRGLAGGHPDAELGHLDDRRRSRHPPAACRCPSQASKSACTKWSSIAPGRALDAARHRGRCPAATTCPGLRGTCPPTSGARAPPARCGRRAPARRTRTAGGCPSTSRARAPFSQTFAHESTPWNRSTRSAPVRGHVEHEPVVAGRVLGRDPRRIERDRVGGVRVERALRRAAHRPRRSAGERRELLEHPVRRHAASRPSAESSKSSAKKRRPCPPRSATSRNRHVPLRLRMRASLTASARGARRPSPGCVLSQ